MTTKITIANLDKWGACDRADNKRYSDANLKKLFRGKKSLTLEDVLRKRIPDEDKVWVATQPGVMTKKQIGEWLEIVVTRAVKNHALHCGIESVEQWAENWLSGKDRTVKAAEAARAHVAAKWAAEAARAEWAEEAAVAVRAAWAHVAAVRAEWAEAAEAAAAARAAWGEEAAERKKQVSDLREVLNKKGL